MNARPRASGTLSKVDKAKPFVPRAGTAHNPKDNKDKAFTTAETQKTRRGHRGLTLCVPSAFSVSAVVSALGKII